MKLAFFSSIVADGNPTTGYEIANEAIIAGLRDLGHQVSVFGFRLPRQKPINDPDTHVLGELNLENVSAGTAKKIEWIVRAVLRGMPVAASKLTVVSENELERRVQAAGPFDANILNSYQMAAAFPKTQTTPYIYVAHNVEHRTASENEVNARSLIERHLFRRDARLLQKLEDQLCIRSEFVWTFSDDDLAGHKIASGFGCALPLVTPWIAPPNKEMEKRYDVGLIGTWSWKPNLVGLNWFLDEVVKHLPADTSIAIAGSVPEGFATKHKNVELLGRVESAEAFLRSVRIVPLVSRGGTGVQLKTIEALQAGYACVATASSVRGIQPLPDNCRTTDDPGKFAEFVASLEQDSKLGLFDKVNGQAFYKNQKSRLQTGLVNGILKLT